MTSLDESSTKKRTNSNVFGEPSPTTPETAPEKEENEDSPSCFRPFVDFTDFLNLIAIIFLAAGFIATLSACMVPREPTRLEEYDSAREAEKGQREFAEKIEFWDYILLLGMFFVAFGGVIVTLLMVHGWLTYEMYRSQSEVRMYKPDEVTATGTSRTNQQQYGSIN